ncbi:hypothetical protein SDRG_15656 [Saprolegnia diclina VS20]|uniref:Nucleotide-diphospho-sugar transferase domain-containing protein n=1 Tax=Saprolegnia diclina (strain VS20) TaxID=1156394 RepID=T0R381_SAPDV|nr:hypothetical protein SDRG_15656 [Saprolegnia diclina VS20]EQC26478.1 hypothetical protein SDRG_15656 [Saprolegnia diclina VS20]|eukprot:XP_008620057.1 hypothetical protein SDRG_15656 [Saprolegnia diclina VS20]
MTRSTTLLLALTVLLCVGTLMLHVHLSGLGAVPFHPQHHSNTTTLPSTTLPSARHAYMLYATNDITACNALIMAKNIRRLGTPAHIDIVVLATTTIASSTHAALAAGGLVVVPVEPWMQPNAPHDTWSASLTKLRIFQERGYDRVIYIDSDSWLERNLDHLFTLREAVFWAPRAYYQSNQPFVGSTLLVLTPSNALFAQLEVGIAAHPSDEWYDMDVLNIVWKDLYGMLPSHYVILNAHINSNDTFGFASADERRAMTYVHHFSEMTNGRYGKPWTRGRVRDEVNPAWHPHFYELFDLYWAAHDEYCTWMR